MHAADRSVRSLRAAVRGFDRGRICVQLAFVLAVTWTMRIGTASAADGEKLERPNFVVVYADDLGYRDLGCFGAPANKTPHLDRMAKEGVRFTDFYVAQAVCSASRTALLTGCYPQRVGILGALGPSSRHGIHDDERTIAEVLKTKGYATAIFGKWHLGHLPQFLPVRHGFDEYLGLPYSNDMWPFHPTAKFPDLPLIEGDRTIEPRVTAEVQRTLTQRYTDRAVRFVESHAAEPFFLYVPFAMPHVPLFAGDAFDGRTKQGIYADVIAEIDASVGRILEVVQKAGIDKKTLVIFTSDNGPWLSYGEHAGSALPLREGKGTSWDGGVRVPFVARWPGRIPAGSVQKELAATIDLLPTLAGLAGADLPPHRIDGLDILPLMEGRPGAKSPHEAYYFYWGRELQAVRSGKWKLHFPHAYQSLAGSGGTGGQPAKYAQRRTELALFDLESDIGETRDVSADHPDVIARLKKLADAAREDLGDSATGQPGTGLRPAGQAPAAKP